MKSLGFHTIQYPQKNELFYNPVPYAYFLNSVTGT